VRDAKRLITILMALTLVVAACAPAEDATPGPGETPAGETPMVPGPPNGEDPQAVCAEDDFGCAEYGPGEPIRLGTILVITGADADLGLDSQYGAEVAAELRGEVAGRQIEWDHQDGQCSAEGGVNATRALVSDPSIAAIVGTSCSSSGVPGSEIASDAGVVMISPSNTAPSLTDPATHQPFYARTAHNDEVQGAAMAEFACTVLNAQTAATVHDGSPYAEQLQQVFADEFQSQCGGEIVAQEAVSPTDTDMRPVLTTIAARSPDLLYYPIFTAGGALMTQQARQTTGLENTALAGADGMQSPTFLQAAGQAAEGIYASGPDLEFAGTFYADEFLPAYQQISGSARPLSVFHAHAFDAANIIFDAIEEVALEGEDGTLYIPRSALRDAVLATSNHEGITGNLTCGENGDCADPAISVSEVRGSEFVRIWPDGQNGQNGEQSPGTETPGAEVSPSP
jgi:branched-chain amino acid transport system substrate-binding protein